MCLRTGSNLVDLVDLHAAPQHLSANKDKHRHTVLGGKCCPYAQPRIQTQHAHALRHRRCSRRCTSESAPTDRARPQACSPTPSQPKTLDHSKANTRTMCLCTDSHLAFCKLLDITPMQARPSTHTWCWAVSATHNTQQSTRPQHGHACAIANAACVAQARAQPAGKACLPADTQPLTPLFISTVWA